MEVSFQTFGIEQNLNAWKLLKKYSGHKSTMEEILSNIGVLVATGNEQSYFFSLKRKCKRVANRLTRICNLNRSLSITEEKNPHLKLRKGRVSTALSGQDLFANMAAAKLTKKFYLEIGACYPIKINNTYILEKYFDWQGSSIEIDEDLVKVFNFERKNDCVCKDATLLDYSDFLSSNGFPNDIGYLSIDIDPAFQSLNVLSRIPFTKYRFAAITFEHDAYLSRGKIRKVQRQLLKHYGYELLVKDVKAFNVDKYEDWWIHPDLVSIDIRDEIQEFFK